MWRNILPQVFYQVLIMIILMFGGQAMYSEWYEPAGPFNIITSALRGGEDGRQALPRLQKDTLCFHTFMLMNIINMINCRVVSEHENNVFKNLFNNRLFIFIFLLEMIVQNAFVFLADLNDGPFSILGVILGTAPMAWPMHLSAWIFGLFVLAIRPLTNKIPVDRFYFMDAIDLETKEGQNFVTKWSDRATEDFMRIANEEEGAATPKEK